MIRHVISAHAKNVLLASYPHSKIKEILDDAWERYDTILPTLSMEHKYSQGLMRLLRGATFSMALYRALEAAGLPKETSLRHLHDINWFFYEKMLKKTWEMAGAITRDPFERLLQAGRLLDPLGFNSEPYKWRLEPIDFENKIVIRKCLRCPIAEYYHANGLVEVCIAANCDQDYAQAHVWGADFKRSHTIAHVLSGKDEYKDKPMECDYTFICRQSGPLPEFTLDDVFG
ncbi:MAG: hypothetical protein C4532_16440 [Candidatus Abyssobacteria bacterium SURF_17]|jgi:ubiquinone biosynthesis protein|uniref:L-2-amino-thiazoline-4-carboxylic acid hydrolase n=1 Tax=Candidatus Abyssobacteria bacterium SURF_17 TaxID=2093361 RepID=A0A419ES76_9BACT|nr:MAG: hypothetical protein C4532_16440 [Candidatus Abyssubacteria bacterium SURF_17]